tara:strand:- start:1514 stop:1972 length:459 start_codon:yes stop_codon:yes gene_type:complete
MRRKAWIRFFVFVLLGLFIGTLAIANNPVLGAKLMGHDMHAQRGHFLEMRDHMHDEMLHDGLYKCCLERPCTYCIEKTPKHGEDATCSCLEDVVNGVHPCGECIGEIMEGHGNPYLSEYFAASIAEEVGEEHSDTLKKIMEEKYDKPVEEQM